ncbi:TonB-dependent receptor [Sphingomonas profundi]|uniref:TonB-dependent receptor n=1 Tax=Alterirhizorhabdus profundi TaxID=2681549 RepID=UPI0012E89CA4|nr:TonB-dependent receptor [Sphingomonas profundi]
MSIHKPILHRGSALFAVAATLFFTAQAQAQSTAPGTEAAPVPAETVPASPVEGGVAPGQNQSAVNDTTQQQGGLEDIVVTARKRAESVQDVPVAVTALSEVQIQRQDLTSLEKVAARTPNFSVGRASNGSGAQLTLRGIGSSSTSIGIEQSVAVVVDGVYYGQGRIIQEGFFDLARLEILKGPQALFFGKNATAGVVSITSADPTDKVEFRARAGYEFRSQQVQGEFVGSGPLTDTLGLRVAVRGSKMFDGYFKNVADPVNYATLNIVNGVTTNHVAQPAARNEPGEKELLGRVTLKWEPTDQLTATLKASGDYNKVNNSSWNYVNFNCENGGGVSTLNPKYQCKDHFVTHQNKIPTDIAPNFPFAKEDGSLYNRYKSYGTTGTINYVLDDVTFTSVTNYNWNNNQWTCACDFQSSNTGTWATENSTWHAFSSELRALTTYDGPINVMVGGLYQKTKRKFEQYIMFAGLEDSSQSAQNRYLATTKNSSTDGETLAAFGQVTWKLAETIEATGGVRYTHETKDSIFGQYYNISALQFIFRDATAPLGIVTANQTFNNWSPEATISWKPMRGLLFYGAYKTAYKSGGFSNSGINSSFSNDPSGDLTFEPEKASGFELGAKTTLLDNQLRFNVGLYTFKYKDLQVDFFNSPIFAFQTLTADARTKGVEVEFEYAPRSIDGLNLHGSVNYNRARYTNFPLAPCYAGQRPSEGCFPISATSFRQNLNGAPLANAPEWTGTLGASYDKVVGNGFRFGASVDARYNSSYIASGFGNDDSRQNKYVNLDASIRFGTEDDRYEIALIGKNLTNRFYVTGVVDGPSTGSGTGTLAGVHADQLGFATLPRTVQVQATFRY